MCNNITHSFISNNVNPNKQVRIASPPTLSPLIHRQVKQCSVCMYV